MSLPSGGIAIDLGAKAKTVFGMCFGMSSGMSLHAVGTGSGAVEVDGDQDAKGRRQSGAGWARSVTQCSTPELITPSVTV